MAITHMSLKEALGRRLLQEEEVVEVNLARKGVDLKLVTGTKVHCAESGLLSAVYAGQIAMQNVGRILEKYQKSV